MDRWSLTLGASAVAAGAVLAGPLQSPAATTFVRDVAPILHAKCVPCHRPGGAAPFALRAYDEVVRQAELVRIQAMIGAMPPCRETTDFGRFSSTAPLTDPEILVLQKWFQAKTPRGEGPEPLPQLPQVAARPAGSVVLDSPRSMPPVRPEGTRYWMVAVIDAPARGGLLSGFSLIPNSALAVRSAMFAVAPVGDRRRAGTTFATAGSMDVRHPNLIASWAPGYPEWHAPAGFGMPIPPNSKLWVQLQYQPTGKREDGGFRLGLTWAAPTAKPLLSTTLAKDVFLIEAKSAPTYEMRHTMAEEAKLVSLVPEARFYASRVRVEAIFPDGRRAQLFETMRWDPYWIGNYRFPDPPLLPKGTVIEALFSYNNDEYCPMNENKVPQDIRSGPKIEDEVCRLHLVFAPSASPPSG